MHRNTGEARMVVPVPKEQPIQHDGYMQLVRMLPCAHCQRPAPSQFCHADEGKGMAIKSDCRLGWPGCADSPGRVGCHTLIGSAGAFTREHKRRLERLYGDRTRETVRRAGQWPMGLPAWPEDEW